MTSNITKLNSLVAQGENMIARLEGQRDSLIKQLAEALGVDPKKLSPEKLDKAVADLEKEIQSLTKTVDSMEKELEEHVKCLQNLIEVE